MLLRAGIAAMSVAIALAVAAVAVTVSVVDEPRRAIAAEQAVKEPGVRLDPPVKARVEYAESPPGLEAPRPEPEPVPRKVEPRTEPKPQPGLRPGRVPHSRPAPKPESPQPRATPRPEAKAQSEPEPRARLGVLRAEPKPEPRPTSVPEGERGIRPAARADAPRRFELPPGVVMTLTIRALGLRDVPVRNSDSQQALDRGVIHAPDTSLPWDEGTRRNVYLAGHRLGWPGTGSHRVFYNLDRLGRGDRVVLEDYRGHSFEYRVTDSFLVGPRDSWVKEVVPGHDMVTLQTCTPIPTFEKRLIVRANRV